MLRNNSYVDYFLTFFKKKNDPVNPASSNGKPSYVTRLEKIHYDLNNVPKAFCDSITFEIAHDPEMPDIAIDHLLDRKNYSKYDYHNPHNRQPLTKVLKSNEIPKQEKHLKSLQDLKKQIEAQIRETQEKLTRYANQVKLISDYEAFVSTQEKIYQLRETLKKQDNEFKKSIGEIKDLLITDSTISQKQVDSILNFQKLQHNQTVLLLKMELSWELEQFLYSTAEVIIEYGFRSNEVMEEMQQILTDPMEEYTALQKELNIIQEQIMASENEIDLETNALINPLKMEMNQTNVKEENIDEISNNNLRRPIDAPHSPVLLPLNPVSFEKWRQFTLSNSSRYGMFSYGKGVSIAFTGFGLFPQFYAALHQNKAIQSPQHPSQTMSLPKKSMT